MKGRGKREIPEKISQPTASSGTIPTCKNPVTRPGIQPGSPRWEARTVLMSMVGVYTVADAELGNVRGLWTPFLAIGGCVCPERGRWDSVLSTKRHMPLHILRDKRFPGEHVDVFFRCNRGCIVGTTLLRGG
ncbi:hypothetical protein PR048_011814 [Dryococelus australis]|uniref:Uncharacterized protein n=1 Tax=Dryococelus australis TaxID=614101 RepID=A0ABQ9HMK4_9NEOP|nr:hypothetical protein PR048_011814 [Dryococelus australis]